VKVTTWNCEWASPTSSRGIAIKRILEEADSDVIVLTEGCRGLLPDAGCAVEGSGDWGYATDDSERRKVIVWSRHPIVDCDIVGHPNLPSGRFASGFVELDGRQVRVLGVCIPWSGAHVRTGRRDRALWQDHMIYLEALRELLSHRQDELILAGDFNQRIPRQRQPVEVHELLIAALHDLSVHTGGSGETALIDHIATSQGLRPTHVQLIQKMSGGQLLTDHIGVSVELSWRKS